MDESATGASSAERTERIPAAGFNEMPVWGASAWCAGVGSAASAEFGSTTPVITVVGDSTAAHDADGLRQWADANRSLAVVNRA